MQSASHIFMVRPANFAFNEETSVTNSFQGKPANAVGLQERVLAEFDAFAAALREAGINVIVFEDTISPVKPDAVFPNNWISLHEDGTLVLYPMCTPNRRAERRADIIKELKNRFKVAGVVDLSVFEKENKFLEGTGSIVFDHLNRVAYACLSFRTDKELFLEACAALNYRPFHFWAFDKGGRPIYHTNVMMCICEKFVVVCAASISNEKEREALLESLERTGREVIEISVDQMNSFAGNMLGLKNAGGENMLVLSQSAYDSLNEAQKKTIERYARTLPLAIPTIESIGGGSARCMIAEIFVPCL